MTTGKGKAMSLSLTAWQRQMVVEGHASEFLAARAKRRPVRTKPEVDEEDNVIDDPWYFEPMS
jgi:hypothetical protein